MSLVISDQGRRPRIERDGVDFFNIDALSSLSLRRLFPKRAGGLACCTGMVA